MIIETEITEKKIVKKEINLPYFSKDNEGWLYKVTNTNNVIRISHSTDKESAWIIKSALLFQQAVNGKEISEEEFEQKFEQTKKILKLITNNN